MGKTKDKCQMRHATNRALERHGVVLNHLFCVYQIQNGEAEFIDRQSNRITRWWVMQDEKKIPVCYDKQRKTIVTVLSDYMVPPPTQMENDMDKCPKCHAPARCGAPDGDFRYVPPVNRRADLAQSLADALEEARRGHYDCEDQYYSCTTFRGQECDCGADEHNAKINAALKKYRGE